MGYDGKFVSRMLAKNAGFGLKNSRARGATDEMYNVTDYALVYPLTSIV